MDHAKMIVHRGATRVTREQLTQFDAPAATATFKPIRHDVLVGAIHDELARREITVIKEEYAVQRNNAMLFGAMTLNWLETDEFAAALAFRHANDYSEAVKMYAGVRVFVCDNMALSGNEIILHKKHSPRFNLAAALPEAFDRYQEGSLTLRRDIETMKTERLSKQRAAEFVYDIFRGKIVPVRLFHPVVDQWQQMTAATNGEGTLWQLHNAFTQPIQLLPPNGAMRSTVKLGKFFGMGVAHA